MERVKWSVKTQHPELLMNPLGRRFCGWLLVSFKYSNEMVHTEWLRSSDRRYRSGSILDHLKVLWFWLWMLWFWLWSIYDPDPADDRHA